MYVHKSVHGPRTLGINNNKGINSYCRKAYHGKLGSSAELYDEKVIYIFTLSQQEYDFIK